MNRACSRSYSAANASSEFARDKLDLPWGEEEVETAVYACFNAWLESRGGSGAGEIMDAILKLRAGLNE